MLCTTRSAVVVRGVTVRVRFEVTADPRPSLSGERS
jgi:hypothetical protein